MVFQNTMMGAAGAGKDYSINQSIRFNDNDTAVLTKTLGTPTDATNWTFSVWIKRCNLGSQQWLFNAGASAADYYIRFETTDKIRFRAASNWDITTTEVFRDVSAWYHFVATLENGSVVLYVNNNSIATASVSDAPYNFFTSVIHSIGASTDSNNASDVYMAEIQGIDGQALSPTNFGETNDYGVWVPKKYTGTYGNNGFYLKGQDNSSLGNDSSGESNDFTASGLTAEDQVDDTPTENYCVLNVVDPTTTGTLSNGNLETTGNATVTIRPESGQWYYEKDGVGVSYNADTSGQFNPTLSSGSYNFGQLAWNDTGPTGSEKAINTSNLPTPTIKDGSAYFQTTLYTGTGSSLAVNQSGNSTFQPDFVWIKKRNAAERHELEDAVRGVQKRLSSNSTDAEDTGGLTSFDSDGFTVDGNFASSGENESTYVAWQWLAGNGTASNSDGSITSTVSANTTSGCSVLIYSGNATSGATIGHGLGAAPKLVITKSRDNGTGRNWAVFHASLGATKYLELNNTDAVGTATNRWNDTAPTSSVVTFGDSQTVNGSEAYVAYCFSEVEGFSKFSSYTGNGSADGTFIWCGFRPNQVVVKETSVADDWVMYDSARDPNNVAGRVLRCDNTDAEFDGRGGSRDIDFLSNGFKLRTSNNTVNNSGSNYIFWAFAEHPFGGENISPVTAR